MEQSLSKSHIEYIKGFLSKIKEVCSVKKYNEILSSQVGRFNKSPFGIKEIAQITETNEIFHSFLKIRNGSKEGQHYLSVIKKEKDTHVEKLEKLEATIDNLLFQIKITTSEVIDSHKELKEKDAKIEEKDAKIEELEQRINGLQKNIIEKFRQQQQQQQQQKLLIDYINKHLSIHDKHTSVIKPIGSELKARQANPHL